MACVEREHAPTAPADERLAPAAVAEAALLSAVAGRPHHDTRLTAGAGRGRVDRSVKIIPSAGSALGRRHVDCRPPPRTVRCRRRTAGPQNPRRQFRRPPSAADRPRGERRGRSLLFLLRRALPAGLSDLDRHSAVHPPDRRRAIRSGAGKDHLRRQHHGRHVRARLPDRDACARKPACARRAEGKPVQIGLLQRYATDARDGDRHASLYARRADRQARRDRRRGAGRPRLRPRAGGRRPST